LGGIGSGGHNSSGRMTVEDCRCIDVNELKRFGYLRPNSGTLTWYREGEAVASIYVRGGWGSVKLSYRTKGYWDEGWEPVEQKIPIFWQPCHFGGERPLFVCPYCAQHAIKLHLRSRFYCRECQNLTYESRREDKISRRIYRAQRLREKLGGSPNLSLPFPSKPKGMHWKTYARYVEKARCNDVLMWQDASERFGFLD